MTNGGLYRVGPFVAVAGVLALLAGCGRFGVFEQREPWRAEAEQQCLRAGLVKPSPYIQQLSAISGPGVCGMDHPLRVAAWAGGAVSISQKLTLSCPMTARADQWVDEVVRPAAQSVFGAELVAVKSGSYSCRPRNNQRGARLSEHSFGNAIDVFSFTFADGREVSVKSGWRGQPEEQYFLREVFTSSCRYFTTVLGPGADAFHYDHFHLDLARHDPRGLRTVCKPVIKHETMPGEGRIDRPMVSYRQQQQPATAVAGDVQPRGAIAGAQPFPPGVYPRGLIGAPGAAPAAGPRLAGGPASRPPIGAPLDLGGGRGAPQPGLAPDEGEEIDADHDPYAVDE